MGSQKPTWPLLYDHRAYFRNMNIFALRASCRTLRWGGFLARQGRMPVGRSAKGSTTGAAVRDCGTTHPAGQEGVLSVGSNNGLGEPRTALAPRAVPFPRSSRCCLIWFQHEPSTRILRPLLAVDSGGAVPPPGADAGATDRQATTVGTVIDIKLSTSSMATRYTAIPDGAYSGPVDPEPIAAGTPSRRE